MSKRRQQQHPTPLIHLPAEVIECIHAALISTSTNWSDLVAWHSTCHARFALLHQDDYHDKLATNCRDRMRPLVTATPTVQNATRLQVVEYTLLAREISRDMLRQIARLIVNQPEEFNGISISDVACELTPFRSVAKNHPWFNRPRFQSSDSAIRIIGLVSLYLHLNFGWSLLVVFSPVTAVGMKTECMKFPFFPEETQVGKYPTTNWTIYARRSTKADHDTVKKTRLYPFRSTYVCNCGKC